MQGQIKFTSKKILNKLFIKFSLKFYLKLVLLIKLMYFCSVLKKKINGKKARTKFSSNGSRFAISK